MHLTRYSINHYSNGTPRWLEKVWLKIDHRLVMKLFRTATFHFESEIREKNLIVQSILLTY